MPFEHIRKNTRFLQYIAAAWVGILQLSLYANLVWGTPTLPKLLSEDSPIGRPLNYEEASWVMSSLSLGMIIGGILLGIFLDILGSKCILLIGAVFTVISWTILGTAKSFAALVAGRIVAGVGDGIAVMCIHIYLCEIGSKDIRGKLGVIPMVGGISGVLLMYGGGPYLTYTTLIICSVIFPLIFIISFPFMPNSPYFLMKKNQCKDAELCLRRLACSATTRSEIESMLEEIEGTLKRDSRGKHLLSLVFDVRFGKSLLIIVGAQSIGILSGLGFIPPYFQIILKTADSSLPTELITVIFGIAQIPSLCLCGLLVDKIGRKWMLGISSFGSGITLMLCGTYFYLNGIYKLNTVKFLPVVFLIAYQLFLSVGLCYVPNLIVGELFTTRTKKIGGPTVTCISSVLVFVTVKICGSVFESWGLYTLFWAFACASFLGVFFAMYVLPETKGKSFEDIQKTLLSSNSIKTSDMDSKNPVI
ncbi:facilitated trehalose transporter Tret1-like [Photinus pyralis]|nr:facilitated trehalose transporter Tret1-like [Photinus pyralis]